MESYLSFKWPMTAPLIAFFFEVCICSVGALGVVGVSIRLRKGRRGFRMSCVKFFFR